jgi:hypothetical protein
MLFCSSFNTLSYSNIEYLKSPELNYIISYNAANFVNQVLSNIFFNLFRAASTFNNGGIIERRLDVALVIDCIIAVAVALGNTDQRSAILPVTNGTAKLVPLILVYFSPGYVLLIFTPGAIIPLFPIDGPKLEVGSS